MVVAENPAGRKAEEPMVVVQAGVPAAEQGTAMAVGGPKEAAAHLELWACKALTQLV